MTAFMVGNDIQISLTQHQRTICTDENPVQSSIKAVLCHRNQVPACCQESRFVDEVGDVRTNHHSFFFQAEDGIRDYKVTGVQTCALPILARIAGAALVEGET